METCRQPNCAKSCELICKQYLTKAFLKKKKSNLRLYSRDLSELFSGNRFPAILNGSNILMRENVQCLSGHRYLLCSSYSCRSFCRYIPYCSSDAWSGTHRARREGNSLNTLFELTTYCIPRGVPGHFYFSDNFGKS